MAFLSWHDRYLLGHAEIDAQHRQLFEIVNHFDDVIQMGMADELGRILDDLLTSSLDHFRFEEEVMQKIHFPGLSDHIKMHAELLQQLQQMRIMMKDGGHVGTKSVVRFLADWLTNHIIREDKAYKPYLEG